MLKEIRSPRDLDMLTPVELNALAEEIRQEIMGTVVRNGGHLASNLGVVELTLALHRVYHTPEDKIVWDVGHQCYAHKLLTGRFERFGTLRQRDGISGFPSIAESEHDAFGAGHSGTAISAALGLARARDQLSKPHDVVAVVGDGALGGGMCYEAINDLGQSPTPMVIVLNDNKMSISPNVGAMAKHLNRLRSAPKYLRLKMKVQHILLSGSKVGAAVYRVLDRFKNATRALFLHDGFFSSLGLTYIGPVDGHDVSALEQTLQRAKAMQRPVLVHVLTRKGKGYAEAENAPEEYHGVAPEGGCGGRSPCATVTGAVLQEMAQEDPRIKAITAAMASGMGIEQMMKQLPDRTEDVGIAEEHAATLAAGMARGGLRPYLCLYSTFVQRCVDQLLHDVALQKLPVVLLVERSGFSGEDGITHQGLYDIAWLRSMPNVTLFAPDSIATYTQMLRESIKADGPVAIRFPKTLPYSLESIADLSEKYWPCYKAGEDAYLIGVGAMAENVCKAAEIMQEKYGIECGVYGALKLSDVNETILRRVQNKPVVIVEEGITSGSFAEGLAQYLTGQVKILAAQSGMVLHATRQQQMEQNGLTPDRIARAAYALWGGKE